MGFNQHNTYYEGEIKPDINTIFVFGSNPEGRHGAGAAKIAREQFGAVYGQGEGLQGNAYALPTKDLRIRENKGLKSISFEQIVNNIKKLYEVANQNPNKQFKIAYRNTIKASLNGYTGLEMIEMFNKAGKIPSNIIFSKEWVETGKLNIDTQVSSQQKQQAIELYSQYLDTIFPDSKVKDIILGSKQDIEGFKNYVNSTSEQVSTISNDLNNTLNLEQRRQVDMQFSAKERKSRVAMIARNFSTLVSIKYDERAAHLEELINSAKTTKEANYYISQLNYLSRKNIIDYYTPKVLFDILKESFNVYVNASIEDKIEREKNKIIANLQETGDLGIDYLDSEELEKEAEKIAVYKTKAYTKVVNNFEALATEATGILKDTEGVLFSVKSYQTKSASVDITDVEDIDSEDGESNSGITDKEESYKDNWMNDWKHMNPKDSLAKEVRRLINEIPKIDSEGYYEEDDLGNLIYLDGDQVHAFLIDKLQDMKSANDLMPMLNNIAKSFPWVTTIVEALENDISTRSKFYMDFRKAPVKYWIHKRFIKGDGTIGFKTIPINKPEGTRFLLDVWKQNQETGSKLNKLSVYDNQGELIKENAIKNNELLNKLRNQYNTEETQELLKTQGIAAYLGSLSDSNSNINTIITLLNSVGVSFEEDLLEKALLMSVNPDFTLSNLYLSLSTILDGVIKDKFSSEILEDTQSFKDLIVNFNANYTYIAQLFSDVIEDVIEASFRENGASYYSFTVPNYIDKITKSLQGKGMTEEEYKQFLEKEYKQFFFFYDNISKSENGEKIWFNDLLEQLEDNPEVRKNFEHKVVLNSDKVEYANWDDLDHMLVLLTEYNIDPQNKSKEYQYSWYDMPILADTASADFIKMRRYTNNTLQDSEGNFLSYQDILTDKFIKLVIQEYRRIKLVIKRDELYRSGDPSIVPIANFDIVRDAEGNIKNPGGSIFSFLPSLNTYSTKENPNFLIGLENVIENGTEDMIKEYIGNAIKDVLESDFENDMVVWDNINLFDKTSDGKYKYLSVSNNKGYIINTIKSLQESKELLGASWTKGMERLLIGYETNPILVKTKAANRIFDEIKNLLKAKIEDKTLSVAEAGKIMKHLSYVNSAKDFMREYYWNSSFAKSQIIQIMTTDLAFYKDNNLVDFQKRFNEVKAPALKLDVNSKYGKKEQVMIILQDFITPSKDLKSVEEVLKNKGVEKGIIMNTLKALSNINSTDAQAWRTLSSFRTVLDMAGRWDDNSVEAKAFERLQNGTWSAEDFSVVFQVLKPFSYTQIKKESGVDGMYIKKPIQNKNSEALLLFLYDSLMGENMKSPKLKALQQFMETAGIDLVQFSSATKTGNQGVINLDGEELQAIKMELYNKEGLRGDALEEEAVLQMLIRTTGIDIKKGQNYNNGKEGILQKLSYEDYGLQLEVPEHYEDTTIAVGSQIKVLNVADLPKDADFIIDASSTTESENTILSKEKLLELNNNLLVENMLESELEIEKIFNDPKQLESIIQEELRGNPRYVNDFSLACLLNENGEFEIPLYESTQSIKIQNLLFSIIKNRVIKQKAKGGTLVQTTGYALSNELSIRYNDASGNLILNEEEFENQKDSLETKYSSYEEYRKSVTANSIAYYEAYLPAHAQVFYSEFMEEGSYELDVNKLDPSLRKLIGYRVPTEGKYSMIPIYIKGFLPPQAGTRIVLPDDIIAIAGIDFDIDKLYILMPEFDIETLQRIKWNPKLDVSEWTREQRNNALLDITWSVLTNKSISDQMLTPGGYSDLKKAGLIIDILKNNSEEELQAILKVSSSDILDTLQSMPSTSLEKLANTQKTRRSPLAPSTSLYFRRQNMTAAKLIGIYANHNANHAIVQNLETLRIYAKEYFINLDNEMLTELNKMYDKEGNLISKNTAQYLGASVDGAKDPVLHLLNQNLFTADSTMLLSRVGYKHLPIGLLLNQPIIEDALKEAAKGKKDNLTFEDVLENTISEYKNKAKEFGNIIPIHYKKDSYSSQNLATAILLSKNMKNYKKADETSRYEIANFYNYQVNIGILYKNILTASEALSTLTQSCKIYTTKGAQGPKISDSLTQQKKIEDFIKKASGDNFKTKYPLVGANVLDLNLGKSAKTVKDLRTNLRDSKLPYIQAAYTLGIEKPTMLLKEYFPQYNSAFIDTYDTIREMTKTQTLSSKNTQRLLDQLMLYYLGKYPLFGNDDTQTAKEKRDYYINTFPSVFDKFKKTNKEADSLKFVKSLFVYKAGPKTEMPMDKIKLKTIGKLSPREKEDLMREWDYMLYNERDPEMQKMAQELFKYAYYTGLTFGPDSFSTLASVYIKKGIPGYLDAVKDIENQSSPNHPFIRQFLLNNLDIRPLVPEIKDKSTVEFFNETKEPLSIIKGSVTTDSSHSNKDFILTISDDIPSLRQFVAKRYKGDFIYYEIAEVIRTEFGYDFTYKKVKPLGYKGQFFEYEYSDIEEFEINSVIPEKKEISSAELLAMYGSSSPIDDEVEMPISNMPPPVTEMSEEELMEAFEEVISDSDYSYLPKQVEISNEKDFNTLTPNNNFTDIDDKPLC